MLSLPPAIFFDACDLVNPLAIATAWGTGMPSIISCRNLGCLAPTVNAAYLPIVLVQRFSEPKGLWISTSDLSRYKSGLHADAFCLVVFPFFAENPGSACAMRMGRFQGVYTSKGAGVNCDKIHTSPLRLPCPVSP